MRALLPLLLLACPPSQDGGEDDTDTDAAFVFEPIAPPATAPDVRTDRLCAEAARPDDAPDTTFLDCEVDVASFADPNATPSGPLTAMVWNLERGLRLDDALEAWEAGDLPRPDLLLVSELDRGCSRTGGRDVSREIAEALEMDMVFGVEFLELPREDGAGGAIGELCEHGNAVFSRFPLGNAGHRFHRSNSSWYLPPGERTSGEPRLGGRSLVWADARVGDRYVRLVSLHYESRVTDLAIQQDQGVETAELADASPVPVLVGGDTNSVGYSADVFAGRTTAEDVRDGTVGPILQVGLVDAHATLPADDRPTRSGIVIDVLLGRGATFADPAVCPGAVCDPLSDHRAVWADLTLD